MAIFGPKPWANPFGKMLIFRLFEIPFFYSLEWRFFVLEYRKREFFFPILPKIKVRKMAIFEPKPWLTLLEKCQFFDFLNFLFL